MTQAVDEWIYSGTRHADMFLPEEGKWMEWPEDLKLATM